MCKYCEEMDIQGSSDLVLTELTPIGIFGQQLSIVANMAINDDGSPSMLFGVGTQEQGCMFDIYVDDVSIQYCPFCGQKLKELAE